jgi:SAM-dependent methyltransferase
MSLLERLFSIGAVRKAIWQLWYPYLTRRLRSEEVLFLNYAFETDPPVGLKLDPADEPNRACIQLYHHVATQVDLQGKNVLEVSCGHGGGASWLTRTLHPASYTGLDLNPTGIAFCKKRHQVPGLRFVQGDAQSLSFPPQTFDAVINVEASHCYPDFPGFLAKVARVLKTGGHFLYADFRFRDQWAEWEKAIANSPLVKTAIHGGDPNWGRLIAVAGRAGVAFELERAAVTIGPIVLFKNGRPYDDAAPEAATYLQHAEVSVGVNLGVGPESATVWTCDLSADYVRINAEYRT